MHEYFQFLKNPRISSTWDFDYMIKKGSIHLVSMVNKLPCVTQILKTMLKINFDNHNIEKQSDKLSSWCRKIPVISKSNRPILKIGGS